MRIKQTHARYILDTIIKYRFKQIIDCIKFATSFTWVDLDETCDHEHVNTFIFRFSDESVLKIDMDGDVYLDDDYQNAYNIFI